MKWELFVQNVREWAEARNLIKGSTVQAQALKGLSEAGELADNVAKGNLESIKDDIGDNCVVAVIVDSMLGEMSGEPQQCIQLDHTSVYFIMSDIAYEWSYYLREITPPSAEIPFYCRALADKLGLDFEECLEQAWNDIKDRKGIMHNGVFVKSTDQAYEGLVALYASK